MWNISVDDGVLNEISRPILGRLAVFIGLHRIRLYSLLSSDNLDYRIKVLRQLRKRDALCNIKDESELTVLAALLDRKPLYDWRHEEFGHIGGLTAGDTVKC